MRLAIFWHDMLHYHAARIRGLVEFSSKAGHTVRAYILCSANADLPSYGYADGLDGSVKILSDDPTYAGEFSRQSKRDLLAELDKFNPDAVAIIGYTGPVSRATVGWCRYHRKGAVLMLSSHAADYARVWWKEWPKRRLVSLYDAAFVSGQPQAAYARQLGISDDRIAAGYGVVDNDFWQKGAESARSELARAELASGELAQWGAQTNLPERYFLTVCRFVDKKNLDGLLRAYAKYVNAAINIDEGEPWSLVLVGDGPLMSELQQQVTALNLTDLVQFSGYLPAYEMTKVYGLASAFVLASDHAEQWGLVVNEAMAAGLPVLVSDICGCVPDLVVDGETGFSFYPKDEDALAQLFGHLSSGIVDLAKLGQNAQKRIEQFSPDTFAENLFAVAGQAIAHANRRQWRLWPPPRLWI